MMAKFVDTIVCDDIRVEDNGKMIVIGIYSGDILAHDLNSPFTLCLWVRFFGLEPGPHKNTLVISFNGDVQHRLTANTIGSEGTMSQGFAKGVLVNFNGEEGRLEFAIEFEDDNEIVDAGGIEVRKKPDIEE